MSPTSKHHDMAMVNESKLHSPTPPVQATTIGVEMGPWLGPTARIPLSIKHCRYYRYRSNGDSRRSYVDWQWHLKGTILVEAATDAFDNYQKATGGVLGKASKLPKITSTLASTQYANLKSVFIALMAYVFYHGSVTGSERPKDIFLFTGLHLN